MAFLCVLQLVGVGSAHLLAASVGRVQAAGVASYASQYVIVTCRRGARAGLRAWTHHAVRLFLVGRALVLCSFLNNGVRLAWTELGLQVFQLCWVCTGITSPFRSGLNYVSAEYSSIGSCLIVGGAPIMAIDCVVNSLAVLQVGTLRAGRHINHTWRAATEILRTALSILCMQNLLVLRLVYLFSHACCLSSVSVRAVAASTFCLFAQWKVTLNRRS